MSVSGILAMISESHNHTLWWKSHPDLRRFVKAVEHEDNTITYVVNEIGEVATRFARAKIYWRVADDKPDLAYSMARAVSVLSQRDLSMSTYRDYNLASEAWFKLFPDCRDEITGFQGFLALERLQREERNGRLVRVSNTA